MPLRGRSGPTEEEIREYQEEMQREREQRQQANQIASSHASQASPAEGMAEPGYWDILTSPDIGSGIEAYDQHIEDYLSVELSPQHAIANITYDDWESWSWRIENEFWTMRNEMLDQDSNLDDIDMLTMYGEKRPRLTNQRERQLRSASNVKKLMVSNSIDARGQRSGTEIHAVTRSENTDQDEEESGRGSRVKNWLST